MTDLAINQNNNNVTNGNIIAGDLHNHNYKKTKLSSLFDKLQIEYNSDNKITTICDDLQRYMDGRDTIGLEKKLENGDRLHLYESAIWVKEEYSKKLTKFQFYEPAQEIHAFILGVVLEKFTNIIKPMITAKKSDAEILKAISEEIIHPLITLIQEDGCNDIMGLSSTDINGMVYFLTGRCHINWEK